MGKYILQFSFQKRALWFSLSLAIVCTLMLVACGNTPAANPIVKVQAPTVVTDTPTPMAAIASAKTVIVQMVESPPGHYFFKPDTLTIKANTTVVWLDSSDAPHTVMSTSGATSAFETTSNITEGKTFALTFNTPGTYNYHCDIHPNMKAVITVTW
jgi:plastocyanin